MLLRCNRLHSCIDNFVGYRINTCRLMCYFCYVIKNGNEFAHFLMLNNVSF